MKPCLAARYARQRSVSLRLSNAVEFVAAWRCSNCFVAMQQLLRRDKAINYAV
ncbi:MAG: hypothetical protein IJT11_05975 [Bacteroidaceae bacterium]|nr:hypothetical protein [Bacteroidaceae bacterium]